MSKLVVMSLGIGDLKSGFPAVTAQLWEAGVPSPVKFTGSLPAAPELSELYRRWQLLYENLYRLWGWHSRSKTDEEIEIDEEDVTNISAVDFKELCQKLQDNINAWLNSEPFRNIDQQLRTQLDRSEEIRFIIETNNNQLLRLPWHLWNFFEHYPKAEVALSAIEYQRAQKTLTTPPSAIRILAILGNSQGIDVKKDRAFLERLSDKAETKFLVEPQPETLNDQLWEQGWDILFFAGHSSSKEKGLLQLNQTEAITLDKLRYALKKAISRGLKLAIFNSCDGLGLAQSLLDLHIPQVIVMREPVPDVVAQEFFRHFLWAFAGGQSLYASVREARERLEKLEGEYPCATWLPVICQNPAEVPTTWQDLCASKSGDWAESTLRDRSLLTNPRVLCVPRPRVLFKSKRRFGIVLLASAIVTSLLMGVRQMGMLQALELQAFDHLMRQRPDEGPDPRLLVVTVTEEDIQAQNQEYRRGSLSDFTLLQLLQKLEQFQPRAIGLDIYRDYPVAPQYKDLATRLRQSDRLIAVCKVSDTNTPGISPPPEVPESSLGFTDVVSDSDSIIRRHLFYLTPTPASPCQTSYSFNFRLALAYLAEQGILPNFTNEGYLQLGTTIFEPLEKPTGGYQQFDDMGHQVLLNYRSSDSVAEQITLTDILSGSIDPELPYLVKDRIVLIGTTAQSFKDYLPTPYSAGQGTQEMPGVVIQAHMVSQILSAVLDRRPLLWCWPSWGETLWVWGWSVVGGVLVWYLRSPLWLGLASSAALGTLYGICFVFLLKGGWIPLVPPALALAVTSGSVVAYTASREPTKAVYNYT